MLSRFACCPSRLPKSITISGRTGAHHPAVREAAAEAGMAQRRRRSVRTREALAGPAAVDHGRRRRRHRPLGDPAAVRPGAIRYMAIFRCSRQNSSAWRRICTTCWQSGMASGRCTALRSTLARRSGRSPAEAVSNKVPVLARHGPLQPFVIWAGWAMTSRAGARAPPKLRRSRRVRAEDPGQSRSRTQPHHAFCGTAKNDRQSATDKQHSPAPTIVA